jgi:hypothetical protein
MDWQRPLRTRLLRVTLLALLADLVSYVFVGFRLGRGCWVKVTMIASGLLKFCRCCALRLKGESQVGIIMPICVSSEGRIMPSCYHLHDCLICLLVLAGMHPVYLVVELLLESFVQQRCAC